MWSNSEGSRELQPRDPGPELVLQVADAARAPHIDIDQINLSKKSILHIGPRLIDVRQTVHSTEVVKAHVLGLQLEASTGAGNNTGPARRRLRCSVVVFVLWALAVATGLAVYLCRQLLLESPTRLDLNLTEPWYLRRGDWQAMPAYETTFLKLPVKYALVGHSATDYCTGRYNCTKEMLEIQRFHLRLRWADIAPNFFISGDGLVFEGRGVNVQGAMVLKWNAKSISLSFLGDYRINHNVTSPEQLSHTAELLEALVRDGVLHPEYVLLGHCQVKSYTYSPGRRILDKLHVFEHWNRTKLSGCLETKDMEELHAS